MRTMTMLAYRGAIATAVTHELPFARVDACVRCPSVSRIAPATRVLAHCKRRSTDNSRRGWHRRCSLATWCKAWCIPRGVDPRIRRAIDALVASQLDDGEWLTTISSRMDMGGITAPDTNYFTTPQVLWSLRVVQDELPEALARGARFVEAGARRGAWPFWTPKVRRPVDPDVDTTACAAAALLAVDHGFDAAPAIDACLAMRDDDQRFLTWIRGRSRANDVDAVVNANALWLLREHPAAEPVADWLIALIESRAEGAALLYYDRPLTLLHVMSRALVAGCVALERGRGAMLERLASLAIEDGAWGDALDNAYALVIANNLGEGRSALASRARDSLWRQQRPDGLWPGVSAWNGPEHPAPRALWWGAEAWTTAVAIEGLASG